MPLKAGARLGPYQIDAPIGAGGMGEVYRARDTRLDRVVAIKLILGHVAADPQFKQRFDREAKAISALDHPNICTLYDVGQDGDTSYLVMQYLEGETLADRLARAARPRSDASQAPSSGGATSGAAGAPASTSISRGPIPIDTVLRYATEIASALDVAHRHGIVHRDLKPGNVMITKTGVKLLDFGLAKLAEQGGTSVADIATHAAPITGQGSFIGTLHYMSPEQLEGRPVDARSDMFSFGVVLFEMLTGRRAFDGASQAGVIAAIIEGETPALGDLADARTPLPPAARRALERLLRRCLRKDPDDRWHSAADLASELQWITEERQRGPGQDEVPVLAASTAPASPRRERMWMAATAAALLVAAGVAFWLWPRPAPAAEPVTFTITGVGPEQTLGSAGAGFMAVSPDGRRVAFAAGGNDTRLWIRSLGSLTAQQLAGTEGAWQPTWSPDSRFLLFNSLSGGNAPLRRLDVSSGAASTVGPASILRAAWSRTGVILFTADDRRLYQVPESGGQAKQVTELDPSRAEAVHEWPLFLPDGHRFIYCAQSSDPSSSALFLASLDAPGRTKLVDVLSNVDYADGHLVYQRDGTLMAHPFDERNGQLTGEAVPVMEDVEYNAVNGRAVFSVSATGTLVVRKGGTVSGLTTLTWFDENGKAVGTIGGAARNMLGARLSPDRAHVAVQRNDGKQSDLWVIDTDRGVPTRITFDAIGDTAFPVWSPDSARVVFKSTRNGKNGLYQRATAGATGDELLFESNESMYPTGFSPDGQTLLFARNMGPSKSQDIWALPMTGDRKPYAVLDTPFSEQAAVLSPNGHWLAYYSNKSGSYQVYARSFPTASQDVRISTTTGFWPAWSADSTRLYYMTADYHFMSVDLAVSGGVLHPAVPKDLFVQTPGINGHFFSFDPIGRRFLIPTSPDATSQPTSAPLVVITNWTSTLKKAR